MRQIALALDQRYFQDDGMMVLLFVSALPAVDRQ
jgi:hypothetical protein